MSYLTEHIIDNLKKARAKKALSQRSLSTLSGVPQAHISLIERGQVDIQVSTLIKLARALNVELVLVPKQRLSAVNAVAYPDGKTHMPAYHLDEVQDDE